ncbi:papain-like cysteine protease family protein [Dyadobacter sp. 3J3]|uniref:papain-like cysteine protease family protein n=1 Tax=Dyadobacter sp. 3J3 TaxID=2606600 RepID=UPI00135BB1AB|nr:papain-like cysteine protease family protein [Dyadobacter sp. 3J3]
MASNIEYVISSSDDIFEIIVESVHEYFLKDVYQDIDFENTLSVYLDLMKDSLYFLVEYPYVDKVYRNSFYNYYASKHASYQRDCIRITIYDQQINRSDFLESERHTALKEKFLGYFILRPIKAIFGRSLINPAAFEGSDFQICVQKTSCSVFGVKLDISGFPHSSQDGETITCAETTIWSLMEYFGNKYADYKPVLPSQITKTLELHATQRQLPAQGLTMDEISFVLKQYGFGTRLYSHETYGAALFEIIDTYIESGIPLMVGLESVDGGLGHVVVLIGKHYEQPDFDGSAQKTFVDAKHEISYYDAADFATYYVVQDDNLAPYRLITLEEPGSHYDDEASKQYRIDNVVVPLYPKIYLEAYVAKRLIIEILRDELLGHSFEDGFVLRFFLASSRSFKSHISQLPDLELDLKNSILLARMPKFIWVSEIYAKNAFNYHGSEAAGLLVLDATEASSTSTDTLILAAYPDRFIGIDENKFVFLEYVLKNYRYYSNLI